MISVCFSTSRSPISRLIRWFTRSPASHALITFRDWTLGKVFVLEATGRGFRMIPWSKWRQGNQLVARFGLLAPPETQHAALRAVADRLGDEYDSLSLVGFALRRWRKRYANPLASSKRLICSEVVAEFLAGCGIDVGDTESALPVDLLQLLRAKPDLATCIEEGPR